VEYVGAEAPFNGPPVNAVPLAPPELAALTVVPFVPPSNVFAIGRVGTYQAAATFAAVSYPTTERHAELEPSW
jgi:hypothetical protein